MKNRFVTFLGLILLLCSCNNHYITISMLQDQLNIDKLNEITKKKIISYGAYEFLKVAYEPNGLSEVICIDKKTGKTVALTINKDTYLIIIEKSGNKNRLYFIIIP